MKLFKHTHVFTAGQRALLFQWKCEYLALCNQQDEAQRRRDFYNTDDLFATSEDRMRRHERWNELHEEYMKFFPELIRLGDQLRTAFNQDNTATNRYIFGRK